MPIIPKQALFLSIPEFIGGYSCTYPRPFLVYKIENNVIATFSVSSVLGNEHKLLLPSNIKLTTHDPPFPRSSFVAVDETYEFEHFPEIDTMVMNNGLVLNDTDFGLVLARAAMYTRDYHEERIRFTPKEIIACN